MPTRACEVTGDNDPEQRWVSIEARSAFEAVVFYYGTILAQMGPVGCPRPTPKTMFQVRIDGQIYRVRGERALDWANRVAERRFQEAERYFCAPRSIRLSLFDSPVWLPCGFKGFWRVLGGAVALCVLVLAIFCRSVAKDDRPMPVRT